MLTPLISACEKVVDLSSSEKAQNDYINKLFCTTSNLFLYEGSTAGRDDKRLGSHYLASYRGDPEESLDEHIDLASKGGGFDKSRIVKMIKEGAYVDIEKLFFYKTIGCCSGYVPVGNVEGFGKERVDMSVLFVSKPSSSSSPFSDYGVESDLKYSSMYVRPCN